MEKIGIIFWFSMVLIIGCGRYEVNVPETGVSTNTDTSTSTSTSTKKDTKDPEDRKVDEPQEVSGSGSVDVKVDVKVSVKVDKTKDKEDQQINYYVLPQYCVSLNRFDQKSRQLYASWDGDNYIRLYTYNSCWPRSDDVLVKRDESITVCQKTLQGSLVCNLVWVIEINPNDLKKSIREYLDNVKN